MYIFVIICIILAVLIGNIAVLGIARVYSKPIHIHQHMITLCYRYFAILCMVFVCTFILYFTQDLHFSTLLIESKPNTDSIFVLIMIAMCSFLPITCMYFADKFKHENFGNVYIIYKVFDLIVFGLLLYFNIV
jgi:hypothetical protein